MLHNESKNWTFAYCLIRPCSKPETDHSSGFASIEIKKPFLTGQCVERRLCADILWSLGVLLHIKQCGRAQLFHLEALRECGEFDPCEVSQLPQSSRQNVSVILLRR